MLISHIKTKICSYKQQDIVKKKLDEKQFVTFEEVIKLLKNCGLTCHYCSEHVFILYEKVRETKQWSLDRINNEVKSVNRDGKIESLFEGKEFKEMKPEDHPDWEKLPTSKLFYIDFKYSHKKTRRAGKRHKKK